MHKLSYTLFPTILMACVGCGNVMYQQNHQVPNKIWEVGRNFRFEVPVQDTVGSYDFYIDLRNGSDYPYANIYMFVNTTFPSGKTARDTVECILADKRGKWLGKGLGEILDNHILFKENVRFPNTGTYVFEFEQGMREEALPAILDVGVSIEKHVRK